MNASPHPPPPSNTMKRYPLGNKRIIGIDKWLSAAGQREWKHQDPDNTLSFALASTLHTGIMGKWWGSPDDRSTGLWLPPFLDAWEERPFDERRKIAHARGDLHSYSRKLDSFTFQIGPSCVHIYNQSERGEDQSTSAPSGDPGRQRMLKSITSGGWLRNAHRTFSVMGLPSPDIKELVLHRPSDSRETNWEAWLQSSQQRA